MCSPSKVGIWALAVGFFKYGLGTLNNGAIGLVSNNQNSYLRLRKI